VGLTTISGCFEPASTSRFRQLTTLTDVGRRNYDRLEAIEEVRLFAGVSNLFDEKNYPRVFLNGLIDPAPRRSAYAGLSVEF
jgi:outer membrane receptor protein involved in Fe transport